MKALLTLCLFAMGFSAYAAMDIQTFAKNKEVAIEAAIDKGKTPQMRVLTELLMRQDYSRELDSRIKAMVTYGNLSSPKLEALRLKREELNKQLADLNEAIIQAGYETPEVKAERDVQELNDRRVKELADALNPEVQANQQEKENDK